MGFTTLALAASGYDVTAVDINAGCLKVVDALAAARKLKIQTFNGEFGQVPEPGKIYDIILFYASFHHCIDFQELLRTLRPMLADDGVLILACEAVFADFPKPWGLRLDGCAVHEIRTKGWMELAFNESFFLELLHRSGFSVSKTVCDPTLDIFVAKKAF